MNMSSTAKKVFRGGTGPTKCAGRVAIALVLAQVSSAWMSPASAQTVHEITIAAPDVIAIEVRDPAFKRGNIEKLGTPSDVKPGNWVDVKGRWGMVIGNDRSHVRISDVAPASFLNTARADDATSYGDIGGNKVTAVYRKSVPYDSGIYRSEGGATMTGASLKHYIYLKLAKPLQDGVHKIRWPAGTLPDSDFDYSSKNTRAIALHVNQHGYKATDESKIAYLSLWLPGGPAEGAVDFRRYGMDGFQVIDEDGKAQFSSAMRLRIAPSDPEPGNGLRAPLLEYPSISQPPVTITRATPGRTISMTAPKHGFSTGQRIWLDGFSGPMRNLNGFATVGSTTPDGFELSEGPSGNAAPASSGPAQAYPVYKANRAGTYVFELDFGAWKPARAGTYQIHVNGLGVSDPFKIDDDIWLSAARTAIGGLYNHRSGVALDGRFGYTRPASFRPGQTIVVRRSKLPLSWTSNSATGFIEAGDGTKAEWITNTVAPSDYWGGYMDAGDWDRLITHVDVSFLMLDLFESAPDAMRGVSLGIPKSSEMLDRELYADTDGLPDIVHEAIWGMDFFRRLQMPDGSVIGGIESAGHPLLGVPSFLEPLTVFAYAPDHITTYRYAAGAAKLAGVLDRLGNTKLADAYRQSALAAWRFAERVNRDPDAFYSEAKAIATATGAFRNVPWQVRAERLEKIASEQRTAAAAALFRLTADPDLGAIFESAWARPQDLYLHTADGAWEYYLSHAPTANKDLQKRIGDSIVAAARMVVNGQKVVAYPSMKNPYAPMGWGQGLPPDYTQAAMLIRAHQISGDRELLRTMQTASAHILGANQVGLSFTTGLGVRNIMHPLHEDHRAMGVNIPDGITIFGWAPQSETAHPWIFGAEWTPLPIGGTHDNAQYRRIVPNRFAMPIYEYLIEHPMLIMQQEYSVHQSIAPTAGIWMYLHLADKMATSLQKTVH